MKCMASIPLERISRLSIAATNCRKTPEQTGLEAAVDTLFDAGVLTAVDYWKGDSYSSSSVHALIKSMAAYVRNQ